MVALVLLIVFLALDCLVSERQGRCFSIERGWHMKVMDGG